MKTNVTRSYYKKYFKKMVFLANEYVHDLQLAQDLVQDVFVSLITKKDETIHNPDAYFFTSTKRKCLDYLKTKAIRTTHHDQISYLSTDRFYEQTLENIELEAYLMALIEELPKQCKEIFKMSRILAQPNQEIAVQMNLSKRTVETQISKALKKLRSGIEYYKSAMLFF